VINLIKVNDTHYEPRSDSGLTVGSFLKEVDGFYYFKLNEKLCGRMLTHYFLLEIGTKLQELNHQMHVELDEYFEKEKQKL